MTEKESSYEDGRRDGRLASLEVSVKSLTDDLSRIKVMIYMLYGAIALVQFLPELRAFLNGGN